MPFRSRKTDTRQEQLRDMNANSSLAADDLFVMKKERELKGKTRLVVYGFSIALAAFELYGLYIKPFDPWVFRSSYLVFCSLLIFLYLPGLSNASRQRVTLVDFIWMAMAVSTVIYLLIDFEGLLFRAGGGSPEPLDIVFGTIAVVVVLETMRRSSGLALPIIALAFIFYALLGPYLPGLFWHRGYSFERVISFLYSPVGIYTIPLGVSARYVFIFILFGALLQKCGAGDLFVNLAMALTGRTRGGLGKVPIISSALFGTVSGAAVANVVLTGSITIPAMKKGGFRPAVAGAIEAVASTGGQLMPPVMGAAAFLMAEIIQILVIVVAAVVPAILYYISLYFMVDFEAAKTGMGNVEGSLPSFGRLMLQQGHLLLPLLALIYVLVAMQASPNRAALVAIVLTVAVSWFSRASHLGARSILDAMAESGRGIMEIAATTAGAGIIIGILSLTGLGLKAANIILSYSGGNLMLALILSMIICIILGMGVPTVAAYATAAAVIPPALIQLGVSELAAHMFIFYFCILATITPPVAIASYAAAAIAQARMWDVGWTALKYGLAGFIIPYMFIFGEGLLLRGSAGEIILAAISATIGIFILASALQGWLWGRISLAERGLLLVAALTLINQGLLTDLLGYGIFLVVLFLRLLIRKRNATGQDG